MKSTVTSAPRACGRADTTKASMLNANRNFFIMIKRLRGIRLHCLAIYSTFKIRKLHPHRACWVSVDRDEDSTTNRHRAEIQPRMTQIARIWGSVFAIPFVTQHSAFDCRPWPPAKADHFCSSVSMGVDPWLRTNRSKQESASTANPLQRFNRSTLQTITKGTSLLPSDDAL